MRRLVRLRLRFRAGLAASARSAAGRHGESHSRLHTIAPRDRTGNIAQLSRPVGRRIVRQPPFEKQVHSDAIQRFEDIPDLQSGCRSRHWIQIRCRDARFSMKRVVTGT